VGARFAATTEGGIKVAFAALAALHACRIYHGDARTANLLNIEGQAMWIDLRTGIVDAGEAVALPLEQTTRLSDQEIHKRSLEALRQLELEAHRDRYPSQLSGGMQKRLALARAIVTKPELVLFDEPTAGLDPLRRNAVFAMIAKYQRQFGFTAVVVTHDVPEALVASDRVALLDNGRMSFEGTPAEFSTSNLGVVCDFRDSTSALGSSLADIRRVPALQPADS
jgi:phospholipid/cholesterol/gamma-HCH transport system ATP-binding protein